MSRIVTTISVPVLLLAIPSSTFGLPPIPGYLKQALESDAGNATFAKALNDMKSKCDVCHKPMADKKAKGHGLNDFGKAIHKSLDDKAFMAAHKEKKEAEALKLFSTAWTKALEDKNAEGKSYAELVKMGLNPGRND